MYFRPAWDGGFLQGLEKFAKNAGRNPALVLRQANSAMKIVPFDNENIRQKNIVLHK
jgi:Holliday junction resolvase